MKMSKENICKNCGYNFVHRTSKKHIHTGLNAQATSNKRFIHEVEYDKPVVYECKKCGSIWKK